MITLILNSRSDPNQIYNINIDVEKKTVECDCKGFRIHGKCSHIRFYRHLIGTLLDETPSFTAEK